MIVLDAYYQSLLGVALRTRAIAIRTRVFDSPDDWSYKSRFKHVFQTPYGRYWWESWRKIVGRSDPDFVKQGNSVLDSLDQSFDCSNQVDSYVNYLKDYDD